MNAPHQFPKLTLANTRAFSPVATPFVKAVLAARAWEQVIAPKIEAVQARLLQEIELCEAETGERITDPKQTWLAEENLFTAFCAACDAAERAEGLKPASMAAEYCPALVAETARMDAERALLETFADHFGMSVPFNMKLRKQMLELALKIPLAP